MQIHSELLKFNMGRDCTPSLIRMSGQLPSNRTQVTKEVQVLIPTKFGG